MTKHSRLFLSFLATLLVGTLWTAMAKSQSYPNRPITVVVPFAVGGLTDVPVACCGDIAGAGSAGDLI